MLSDDDACSCCAVLDTTACGGDVMRPGVWLLSGRGGVSGNEPVDVSCDDALIAVKLLPPPLAAPLPPGVASGSVFGRSKCGECMAGLCCMLAAMRRDISL